MTTASTPHPAVVALPPKAVKAEEWQPPNGGGRFYRGFEGEERVVVAGTKYSPHSLLVYAHGVQRDDGSIDDGTTDRFDAPAISLITVDEEGRQTDTGITLTGEAARQFADVLVTAADEADGWVAR
jgi:hypothetical protein